MKMEVSSSTAGFDLVRKVENAPTKVFATHSEASHYVATKIKQEIQAKAAGGRNLVLGLATGSTPVLLYEQLVFMHKEEGLSFKNVITFNLDEYYPMEPTRLQSYHKFMHERLFQHIDIPWENINIPAGNIDVEEVEDFCLNYDKKIRACGGIDIQILGIGRSGHVGFNEPGSSKHSKTRMIYLDKMTRVDAAPDFFGLEYVPRNAITMGLGPIMESRKIFILAFSEGKAGIMSKAIEGPITKELPASYLQTHKDTVFILDLPSASKLTRFKCPWVLTKEAEEELKIDYDDQLKYKAVLWLAQRAKKSLLTLTEDDYEEGGLHELIPEGVHNLNLTTYHKLNDTITGWAAGGRPFKSDKDLYEQLATDKKKILIFSPHPDDDVICMGGTIMKLVQQGHEVHVAYQTSGNIAVFDHDAMRFVDFVKEFAETFNLKEDNILPIYQKTAEFLQKKIPGEPDIGEVMKIKSLIRKTEARSAVLYCGVKLENIHFLFLPFYDSGKVKKKPMGEADISIVKKLIDDIEPDYIYAAGDLTDPHGTHRVCLIAILKAIEKIKEEEKKYMEKCTVYLYKGAWEEWPPEKITLSIPMSPPELMEKRLAIFKHQSQKDPPLFPGNDKREFWERAEARNKNTAELFKNLGLTQYAAIEVFSGIDQVIDFLEPKYHFKSVSSVGTLYNRQASKTYSNMTDLSELADKSV